nr:hypothetical protein [Desulfobacterales bacterium]
MPDMETIIEGAKLGDALITSGKGHLTYEWTLSDYGKTQAHQYLIQRREKAPPDVRIVMVDHIKEDIFFAFKYEKVRCDIKSVGKFR